MRDYAPQAAAARLRIVDALLAVFQRRGFARVITPAFEYEDVLALGLGDAARAATVRFVEPSSGQVVALRPDITPQIARMIATRFRDHQGPVRLCYEGTVVRLERAAHGQRELIQVGVEMAGMAGPEGDAEVIALAAEALAAVGLLQPTIDLGHLGLARAVLASLSLPDAALAEARRAIAKRDGAELETVLARARGPKPVIAFARLLPELSGGPEVLATATQQAPGADIKRALADLGGIVAAVGKRKVAGTAARRPGRGPRLRLLHRRSLSGVRAGSARRGLARRTLRRSFGTIRAPQPRGRLCRRRGRGRGRPRAGELIRMPVVIVVGAQWGDEGKGKIVDLLTEKVRLVVRWAGGANAGHTLVVDGKKYVTRLIPSGVLRREVTCVLGEGMVIDPAVLVEEIRTFRDQGFLASEKNLVVAARAHLTLPHHRELDRLREERPGPGNIGTTRKGIGPTYESKAARIGLRVGDLFRPDRFRTLLARQHDVLAPRLAELGGLAPDINEVATTYLALADELKAYVKDASRFVHDTIVRGENVLFEGAQGVLLDVDHGTYPFVTSSSTTAGGACAGLGIGPTRIDAVMGIAKGYATRVGGGPFPTELTDATGDLLRKRGNEFGSVTGRPRRCGWLDLPALQACGAHLGHRGAGFDQAGRSRRARAGTDLHGVPARGRDPRRDAARRRGPGRG